MRTQAYDLARRCHALRADGKPCRSWAEWQSFPEEPRCVSHSRWPPWARRRMALELDPCLPPSGDLRARAAPCRCSAYQWPHRPGGGLCDWPNGHRGPYPLPAGSRYGSREWITWECRRRGLSPGWPASVPRERVQAPWRGVSGSGLFSRALDDEADAREAATRGRIVVYGRVRGWRSWTPSG